MPRSAHTIPILLLLPALCWAQPAPISESPDNSATYTVAGRCLLKNTTEPIPDASVHLIQLRGPLGQPKWVRTTESDEEGRFEFQRLQPPNPVRTSLLQYVLVVDAADHAVTVEPVYHYENSNEVDVQVYRHHGSLQGKVLDQRGKSVGGATIKAWTGVSLGMGLGITTSGPDGSFQLLRLPKHADSPFGSVSFLVQKPGYPSQYLFADVPSKMEIRLETGCTLKGSVRDKASGKGIAGVVVSALPTNSWSDRESTVTEADGRFELCVRPGHHDVILEDADYVAPALVNVLCRTGATRRLDPLVASPGGWLTGRIVHPRTGDAVVFNDTDERIFVNNFGPATPFHTETIEDPMARVDEDGRFRIRVAAGENYPYVDNMRSMRTSSDTLLQSPVMVPEDGVARCFIKIKIPRSAAERVEDAKAVVAELPEQNPQRCEAILGELRALNHTLEDTELWCRLMKELIDCGAEAVPLICQELDQTDQENMLRRLGFVARAINDPRTVPALIRAIPRTLQPPMNDYGLTLGDPELLPLMQKHDLDPDSDGQHFSFGRPVREIFGAINRITDKQLKETELYQVQRAKDDRNRYWQQRQYYRVAQRWRDWWENHYADFGVGQQYAEVNLPAARLGKLTSLPTGLQLTKRAQLDRRLQLLLSPIEWADHEHYFLDVDTGRFLTWPRKQDHPTTDEELDALLSWASKRGADLICIRRQGDSDPPYLLRGLDMQLWEIDPADAKNISTFLGERELPVGRKVEDGRLLHLDSRSKTTAPRIGSCFLYLSREDGLGMITIKDFVTKIHDSASYFYVHKGVGRNLGIRFDCQTIVR